MIRRPLNFAALVGGTLLLAAAAPAGAQAAAACASTRPAAVKLKPDPAGATVTVSWRIPRAAPPKLAYRVARDGAVVGQTSGRRMRVRVTPGRAAKITVTAVVAGVETRCRAAVRVAGSNGPAARAPRAVRDLSVRPRHGRSVRLSWGAAERGARRVAGYRILRNGRPVDRTRKRSLVVRTSSARYQVAALDTAGRAAPASNAVRVKAGHTPPTSPAGPAASDPDESSATLSWGAARAIAGRIAGYRVVSKGRTVRAVKGTSVRLTGLRDATAQTFRIVAVDRLGWASRRSPKVVVTTGHRAPGAPGPPSAVAVTDTGVSLAWSPGALPTGSQLRGYRLMRDGSVVAQVPAAQANAGNLAPKAAHDWSVAAVDTRGYASAPSPATRVVQADPPPTTGGVHAFLLASTDSSFAAFRKHYDRISVVYPTFFDCNLSTGQIEGANNDQIVSFARDRKVRVLPRYNCQDGATLHRIFTDPALRAQWLDGMTEQAVQNGWDGVNVDFEAAFAEDRDLMTAFIADVADRLHARGKLLSQAVSAKVRDSRTHPRSGAFDYPELAKYADWLFVMAWGVHWSTSAPGAQDDFPWVRQVGDYVATMPFREKFVMGTMLYGMDWPAGGGSANAGTALHWPEIEGLIAKRAIAPVYDAEKNSYHVAYTDEAGVGHDLWYSDANAIGDRVGLARERGLKVGFWRLGQEDERIWSDPRIPAGE